MLKGAVGVISNDPPCKYSNAQFTKVPVVYNFEDWLSSIGVLYKSKLRISVAGNYLEVIYVKTLLNLEKRQYIYINIG